MSSHRASLKSNMFYVLERCATVFFGTDLRCVLLMCQRSSTWAGISGFGEKFRRRVRVSLLRPPSVPRLQRDVKA